MDTVTVDGKTYIKAAKAAALVGYTADYIGQLCRKRTVEGIVLGKTWYVREESLLDHKHSQTRINTATTKRDIAKQKGALQTETTDRTSLPMHFAHRTRLLNTAITYEPDMSDLLPTIPSRAPVADGGDIGETSEEISIEIRKVADADTEYEATSVEREVQQASATKYSKRMESAWKGRKRDRAVEGEMTKKSREKAGTRHRLLFIFAPFLLALLVSIVLESTLTYTDTHSGQTQFKTTYNFVSIHTIKKTLNQILF